MENIGYLECLIKLLNGYSSVDTDNDIESQQFFQKIIKLILTQIRHMIKYNPARSEQLTVLGGIPLIIHLSHQNNYNNIIIPIIAELINSTQFVRESLKKENCIENLINFIKDQSSHEFLSTMIDNLIEWLKGDKEYVESYIVQDNVFSDLNKIIHQSFSTNLNEYLNILLELITNSDTIEKKYFTTNEIVKYLFASLVEINFWNNKDVHLINLVMDYLYLLAKNKKDDKVFLTEIKLMKIIDKIKLLTEEHNLIIVEEKLKKIYAVLR